MSATYQSNGQAGTDAKYIAAYEFAELGFAVFPCNPNGKGNAPACEHGCNDATCDANIIDRWWKQNHNVNIGVSTNRLLVVDIDGPDNEWPTDPDQRIDLSAAPAVQTPGGGRHYYFRQPDGCDYRNTQGKLAPKVDTRANGGYVVAPPSTRGDNSYRWLGEPLGTTPERLPLPPQWLLDALEDKATGNHVPAPSVNGSIHEGNRNGTLASLAGTMRRRGMEQAAITAALQVENQTKCKPPLPDDEVEQIAASVARYEPGASDDASRGPFKNTDYGNAERFVNQHGADVRYCHPRKLWFIWEGSRWQRDESGGVERLAKKVARSIYREAADSGDPDAAQTTAKHAAASEKRERLSAMIALAQSEQPIPIAVDSLDNNPWLLNCPNGTIELQTGELRQHDRGDLLTKTTGVEYPTEPGEDAVLWSEFLETIFDGNQELIRFVQRLFGASLVGAQLEHVLAILHGKGANGKSVFTSTVQAALGDYAMTAPPNLLMAKREAHPAELACLFRKRLVVISETRDGARLDEGLVKSITGGDAIRAREMRENFWEFKPSHLPVIATNFKPVVRGTDYGIWRRLRLIPFNVTIPTEKQDKRLPEKLQTELPAILRWLVEGCLAWRQDGLQEPPIVLAATEAYRAESDTFGRWFEECCEVSEGAEWKAGSVYSNYKSWCEEANEKPLNTRRFGEKVQERFTRSPRRRDGYYYYGFRHLCQFGEQS